MKNLQNTRTIYMASSIGALLLYFAIIIFSINDYENFVNDFSTNCISNLFLATFSLSVFQFYNITISTFDGEGFNDLLWKSFITGLVIAFISTTLFLLLYTSIHFYTNFSIIIYYVLQVVIIVFVCLNFFIFKKMILYHKSKETANLWQIFEVLIFISIFYNFFEIPSSDLLFPLSLIPILCMGLILTFNLRWIAYLNYKLKIKATLFLVAILFFALILVYITYYLNSFLAIGISVSQNIFIISLLFFIILYSIISVLVLLFNLPTSSVFEQKFSEVLNLQRISGTSQFGKTEDEVYEMLIDSCLGTFLSSTAVLEILGENGEPTKVIYKNFDLGKFNEVKVLLRKNNLNLSSNYLVVENLEKLKQSKTSQDWGINSFLVLQLHNFGEKLGTIYLFSDVKYAFEKEMIEIVITYVNQASSSISNYRLLSKELENVRYKEEIEIAKKVKKHLIPSIEINNDYLEIAAMSKSADEVGGDFYDFYEINATKFAIIIGDVSGKGTTAAFSMAAMKGIFHSLIQNYTNVHQFANQANTALSICLEKSSFVTISLYVIDSQLKKISHIRAGHCPTFYKSDSIIQKIQPQGLGLGIVRNNSFSKFIESIEINYNSNDLFFAFTDGIVEAENSKKNQFGYHKIEQFIFNNSNMGLPEIKKSFEKYILDFAEADKLDDDYTFLIVKLK